MKKLFRWLSGMCLLALAIGGVAPARAAGAPPPAMPAAERLVVVEGFMRYG